MIKAIRKNWDEIYKVTGWASLFVVMSYCVLRYLFSTSFGMDMFKPFLRPMFFALVATGAVRVLLGICNDIIKSDNKKQIFFSFLKIAVIVMFAVPCFVCADRFGYSDLTYLPFAMFCLYGVDARLVMKTFAISIGILFLITVLSALSGLIPNYIYLGGGRRGSLRGSYGICYPTDCASYPVFMFLAAWGSGRFRKWRYTALYIGIALLTAYLIYTYIRGVNSTICSLLIAFVVLYDAFNERVLSKHKATKWITWLGDFLTAGAFPLFAAAVYALTWLYGKGNGLAVRIDQLISNRLKFTWEAYQNYGLHGFGARTPQSGGGLVLNDNYEFIDSSYGVILIRYGWIFTIIIAAIWIFMTVKAIRNGNRRIAFVFAVVAFHSIIEQRLTEIHYDVFLLLPLCSFALCNSKTKEKPKAKKEPVSRRKLVACGIGAALVVIFILFLPDIMSRARSLKYWHESMGNGKKAFAYWFICLALFALFGYFLYRLIITIIEKKKFSVKAFSGVAVAAICAVSVSIVMNSFISDNMRSFEPKIESEKSAIQLILDSAKEPVYSGQAEEFYKRSFNGISDRILCSEELARIGQGSILIEHDNEAFQLIRNGARYVELSSNTGLFTYDDAVIDALRKDGYQVHGYYSAERNVDFKELAKRNGLQISDSGALKLQGSEHSVYYGPCMDQISGQYSVTFSLQFVSGDISSGDTEICAVRVSELSERKLRSERVIYARELDENRHIDVTLNYSVKNTCNVEYPVLCRDGIEINVENISWRGNPDVDTWREYDTNGYLLSERYFTAEGEPLIQLAGHYGIKYEYTKGINNWAKAIYLDADGKTPKKISSGYAQIERKLNKLEKVTEERYFDINGEPCMCTSNYACIRRTFDSRGNELTTSYYDTEDKLIRINSGYAEIHREYDEKNRVILETYFGEDGKPVVLNKNQAGVKYEYDDDDNIISWRYLDVSGDPVIITDGYAEIHRSYNNKKWVTEESYYDIAGNLLACPNGYAVWIRSYDNVGNVLNERFLDTERQLHAEIRKEYNSDNRVIHEAYFDTDGSPMALSKNQAAVAYEYDAVGNCVRYLYLDTEGKPVLLTDGWAELHRVYNVKKQIIEESFYDVDGNLLLRPNGYAVAQYAYDDANNRNSERYFDTERNPVRNTSGYAELHRVFDNRNRVIKDSYFDENGAPIALPKNQASVEYGYDEMGNTVLYRYLDTEGKPVLLTDNYSELRRVYSASRKLLEESYYDTEGNPSDIYGRYAKYENKYDDNNNLTLTYFTNAAGDRVQCGSSYFHEFLQSLKNRDITIFISIKDEGTKNLTNMLLDDLKEIGIKTDLKDKYRYSFYAVVKQGVSQENFSNTESISNSGQFDDVSYSITSAGGLVGNTSSIIINGEEYSKNKRGMNFVIVDSKTGEVIDSVAFDTYSFDMWPTR